MAVTLPKASSGPMRRTRISDIPSAADVLQAPLRSGGVAQVPNIPTGGGSEIGASLFEVGAMLKKAEDRETDRNEALDRMRLTRAYREKVSSAARQVMVEGDFTNPQTTKDFGGLLDEIEQETLGSHVGRPGSQAKLAESLQTYRLGVADRVSNHAIEAQQKMILKELEEENNDAVAQLQSDPEAFEDIYKQKAATIDDQRISDSEKVVQKNALLGVMGQFAVTRMINGVKQMSAQQDTAEYKELVQATKEALDNPSLSRAWTPKQRTALMSAFDEARKPKAPAELVTLERDGRQQTFRKDDPQVDALIAGGAVVRPGQPTPERAEAVERAKLSVKMEEKIDVAGAEASRTIAEIDRMEAALDSGAFKPGAFANTLQFLGRVGERLGIEKEIKSIVGDAKTADVLDAASKRLGIAVAERLGGRVTNVILKFIEDSVADLSKTEGGNRVLLKTMRRIAERDKEIADLKDEFLLRHETLRPKGQRSFQQARRDLEERDPIITEELRAEISKEADIAPKSFKDVVKDAAGSVKLPRLSTPEEVEQLPPGADYIWKDGNKYRKNGQDKIGGGEGDDKLLGPAKRDNDRLLTPDDDDLTKDEFKQFDRIFPEFARTGPSHSENRAMNEIEVNNALVLIKKNRGRTGKDRFTDEEIRKMSTNPSGRMGGLR